METFSTLLTLCERNPPINAWVLTKALWCKALLFTLMLDWTSFGTSINRTYRGSACFSTLKLIYLKWSTQFQVHVRKDFIGLCKRVYDAFLKVYLQAKRLSWLTTKKSPTLYIAGPRWRHDIKKKTSRKTVPLCGWEIHWSRLRFTMSFCVETSVLPWSNGYNGLTYG